MKEDFTIDELMQIVKTSDDSEKFILLLQKISDNVANIRIKIPNATNDSIELRSGIVNVINDMLLKQLTKSVTQKPQSEPTRYS